MVATFLRDGKRMAINAKFKRYMKYSVEQYKKFLRNLLNRDTDDFNTRPVHYSVRSRALRKTIRSKPTRAVSYRSDPSIVIYNNLISTT